MCRRDEVGAVVGALVSPLTFSHIPPAPPLGNLCSDPAGPAPALCAEGSRASTSAKRVAPCALTEGLFVNPSASSHEGAPLGPPSFKIH